MVRQLARVSLALLVVTSCARGQDPLAWDCTPGTRYTLSWAFAHEKDQEGQNSSYTCAAGVQRDDEWATEERIVVGLELALVAPVQSGSAAVLDATVTRLDLTTQSMGLRLRVEYDGVRPPRSSLVTDPAASDPAGLGPMRDRQDAERKLLLDDIAAGLRLVFEPGQRPRLERAAGTVGSRAGSTLWRLCFVQPGAPGPLSRKTPLPVEARDALLFVLLGPPPAALPAYRVTRHGAERTVLDLRWKDWSDGSTPPDRVAGVRLVDVTARRREVIARTEFDGRGRHVERSVITGSAELSDGSTANGMTLSGVNERAQLRAEVRVKRLPRPQGS